MVARSTTYQKLAGKKTLLLTSCSLAMACQRIRSQYISSSVVLSSLRLHGYSYIKIRQLYTHAIGGWMEKRHWQGPFSLLTWRDFEGVGVYLWYVQDLVRREPTTTATTVVTANAATARARLACCRRCKHRPSLPSFAVSAAVSAAARAPNV